jgi:hypothetical protein
MLLIDIFNIFLFLIILFLLFKKKDEKFDGVSYVDDYDLTKCCNSYGCNSFQCQYFLNQRQAPFVLIGTAIRLDTSNNKNGNTKLFSIYRRYNVDTKLYEYYYEENKDKNNPNYIKLDTDGSEMMSKDIVKINNEDYYIQIHNMNSQIMNNSENYNPMHTFPRFNIRDNVYSNQIIKPIIGPAGIVESLNGKEKYLVLQQVLNPQRQVYNYLVNINDNLIQLPFYRRLEDEEIIKIPELGGKYRFRMDNRDTYFI